MLSGYVCVFFFKQKTAYDMRISDLSSDVCSSDLRIACSIRFNKLATPAHCRMWGGQVMSGRKECATGPTSLVGMAHALCEDATKIGGHMAGLLEDRKSTRLNSSH